MQSKQKKMINFWYGFIRHFVEWATPHSFILHQGLLVNSIRNIYICFGFFLVLILAVFNPDIDFFANAFKDPASPVMEGIIDFHHDVFFFLILILIVVSWFLIRILCVNIISDEIPLNAVPRLNKPTQIQLLEFAWTLVPTIILFMIAVPSFTLLYAMNELLLPAITVKATGNQWFWNYEITDTVDFGFITEDDKDE